MPKMRALTARAALVAALAALGAASPALAAAEETPAQGRAESQSEGAERSPSGPRISVTWRLDPRIMTASEPPDGFMVMAAEADVAAAPTENLDVVVQLPFATAMEGRGREMHFGNAYLILRRKLGEPTLKLGQFVVPFGNLPYYETHTRIIQTLYRFSLGIRIDAGAEIEGFLGKGTEFQVALTNGSGPYRMDNNRGKVLFARVNRTFELGNNELRLGVSGMRGTLPVFAVMADPILQPDAAQVLEFARKWRAGLDAELYLGPYLLRAEVLRGEDRNRRASGHWLQFGYPLSYRASLEVGTERWGQFSGAVKTYWVGGEYKVTDRQIVRAAVQRMRAREHGDSHRMTMGTVQFLVEF